MFGTAVPGLEARRSPAWDYDLATAAPEAFGAARPRWFDDRVGTDGRPQDGPLPTAGGSALTVAARAARTVAVVCLLGIAAVALPGRRGLDWDRLTGVPDVSLAQVVLGTIGATLVVVTLWRLVRVWRKLRPTRPDRPRRADGPPAPWFAWVLAVVVTLATMAGAYLLIRLLLSGATGSDEDGPAGPDEAAPGEAGDGLLPLLVGMVVLLTLAGAAALLLRRGAAVEPPVDPAGDGADAGTLADAVTAAGLAMDRYDDTRAAIIAAYQEMARRLGRVEGGRPSDTPTELLDRAVAAGLVSRGAALELTNLFREARFSRHDLPAGARAAAEAALERVAAELAMAGV
jgi:hypothetical protein